MIIEKQRNAVVEEVKSWIGTPYHHMGRKKKVGVDCGMLPLEVYKEAGILAYIEVEYYPPDWSLHRGEEKYLKIVQEYCNLVTSPLPGDLAVYQNGRCIGHGAIVIDATLLIHAVINQGVVYLNAQEPTWATRFRGWYRPKEWCL